MPFKVLLDLRREGVYTSVKIKWVAATRIYFTCVTVDQFMCKHENLEPENVSTELFQAVISHIEDGLCKHENVSDMTSKAGDYWCQDD